MQREVANALQCNWKIARSINVTCEISHTTINNDLTIAVNAIGLTCLIVHYRMHTCRCNKLINRIVCMSS